MCTANPASLKAERCCISCWVKVRLCWVWECLSCACILIECFPLFAKCLCVEVSQSSVVGLVAFFFTKLLSLPSAHVQHMYMWAYSNFHLYDPLLMWISYAVRYVLVLWGKFPCYDVTIMTSPFDFNPLPSLISIVICQRIHKLLTKAPQHFNEEHTNM